MASEKALGQWFAAAAGIDLGSAAKFAGDDNDGCFSSMPALV